MAVPAGRYYEEYHGHTFAHLQVVHKRLRERAGVSRFIFLAGDSSLDNKHWFFDPFEEKADQLSTTSDFVGEAINGYEMALTPALMVKDVCYWLNVECASRSAAGQQRMCAINTAVEESCLSQREAEGLLPQDEFIRGHITEQDALVVDVGGNDVALRPTLGVVVNMAILLYLTPTMAIRANLALGLLYFVHMFRVRLRRYIERLVHNKRPRKVVVCMLYYLDEKSGGSWCDDLLGKLGYDTNPQKLQTVIRKVYQFGVAKITLPGVDVVPLPLFEVLDGKDTTDYVQRVEPSVSGGQKMAKAIAARVFDDEIR